MWRLESGCHQPRDSQWPVVRHGADLFAMLSEEGQPCQDLDYRLSASKVWEDGFLLFKPLSLWYFVTTALTNACGVKPPSIVRAWFHQECVKDTGIPQFQAYPLLGSSHSHDALMAMWMDSRLFSWLGCLYPILFSTLTMSLTSMLSCPVGMACPVSLPVLWAHYWALTKQEGAAGPGTCPSEEHVKLCPEAGHGHWPP